MHGILNEFVSEFGVLGTVLLGLMAVGGIVIYFLPMLIANGRRATMRFWIGTLNVLAGWSVFGWVIAFVWAIVGTREEA